MTNPANGREQISLINKKFKGCIVKSGLCFLTLIYL